MLKLNNSTGISKGSNARRRQIGRLGLHKIPNIRPRGRLIPRGFTPLRLTDGWRMVPVFALRSRSGALAMGAH